MVTNAIKYSPDGGRIKLSATQKPDSVMFSVEDQGVGLSDEDMDELFKPFPEIDNNIVRHGTGLGLSISKGIVDLHKGEIWAESEGRGKGAVFNFSLPLRLGASVVSI